jgi:formylglycine-generating enzyme required for sulfatase activity
MTGSAKGTFSNAERRVVEAPTELFTELVRLAGLQPSTDFRFANLYNAVFDGCDLSGFDFTGACLTGCSFRQAKIAGACFDFAQVSKRALKEADDWKTLCQVWKKSRNQVSSRHLGYFDTFFDAPYAPEMVLLPPGQFWFGSTDRTDGKQRKNTEGPQHLVEIPWHFAMAKFPVTFDEYNHFCREKGRALPDDGGWGRSMRPVINISFSDAMDYCVWLSERTARVYRLPTEVEWEYACRGGTTDSRYWGRRWNSKKANGANKIGMTLEVGLYPPNPWGLFDMIGTVHEWCLSGWEEEFLIARRVERQPKCEQFEKVVVRGGCWQCPPEDLRCASRIPASTDKGAHIAGFRPILVFDD